MPQQKRWEEKVVGGPVTEVIRPLVSGRSRVRSPWKAPFPVLTKQSGTHLREEVFCAISLALWQTVRNPVEGEELFHKRTMQKALIRPVSPADGQGDAQDISRTERLANVKNGMPTTIHLWIPFLKNLSEGQICLQGCPESIQSTLIT